MALIGKARNALRNILERMFRIFQQKSPRSVVYKDVNRTEYITMVLVLSLLLFKLCYKGFEDSYFNVMTCVYAFGTKYFSYERSGISHYNAMFSVLKLSRRQ